MRMKRLGRARWIATAAVMVVLLVGIGVWTWRNSVPMPRHDGSSLKEWLRELENPLRPRMEAVEAVRSMGADCVPYLVLELERCCRTNRWEGWLAKAGVKQNKMQRRFAAMVALQCLGQEGAGALPFLYEEFERDPQNFWLQMIVGAGGDPEWVVSHLRSPDEEAYRSAALLMGGGGGLRERVLAEGLRLLKDPDPVMRARVPLILRFAVRGGWRYDREWIALLQDESPVVVEAALRELTIMGEPGPDVRMEVSRIGVGKGRLAAQARTIKEGWIRKRAMTEE